MYSDSRKNIEKMAAPSSNPTMLAPVSDLSRKIENGRSGAFARSSTAMKPASSTAAPASAPSTLVDVQLYVSVVTSP